MKNSGYPEGEVGGDFVVIRYVPLSSFEDITLLSHKKHDIGKLAESIEKYGFIDPPKWDETLNNSEGGFVYGNGRSEAIFSVLKERKRHGQLPPRGIAIHKESGEWCVPVKFNVDCQNESQALALVIDHNNLTMLGGDGITALDMSRMWNESEYLSLLSQLQSCGEMPISNDADDLSLLLEKIGNDLYQKDNKQLEDSTNKTEHKTKCPNCGHEF